MMDEFWFWFLVCVTLASERRPVCDSCPLSLYVYRFNIQIYLYIYIYIIHLNVFKKYIYINVVSVHVIHASQ